MAGTQLQVEGYPTFVCLTRFAAESTLINALDGIDVDVLANRATCFVRQTAPLPAPFNGLYRWYQESVAAPDGLFVIVPLSITPPAPGRWLLEIPPGPPGLLDLGGEITLTPVTPSSKSFVSAGAFGPPTVLDLPTILNPVSALFDMPAPGRLRYIGPAPRRFQIHGQVIMLWTDRDPAGATMDGFFISVLVNGSPRFEGAASEVLTLAGAQATFHAQAFALLAPGDFVELGIGSATGGGVIVDTVSVFVYSLLAA